MKIIPLNVFLICILLPFIEWSYIQLLRKRWGFWLCPAPFQRERRIDKCRNMSIIIKIYYCHI
ncbi:MAG: hypothetical protein CVV55_08490 [Synergistetes bacterium HGW-Synergistetes-2]|nr:MAG: hypothetical protein CVV55_08490 [Synergistetes bacterium HGW-Synergistetes-2]